MNYPLISEYIQAIKLSEENFDKLTNLCPVLDVDGNHVMSSGNFAVVFKMQDKQTGKFYAVKCFLREQEGREESYKLIASELEYISSTFLTHIKYFEKELFVDTAQGNDTEFPVLLMDWVEGLTLDKYIRNNIHDQYKLALIAYQFCRMGSWLLSQEFAHGDLKPDNIIVREDGQLVLVDYDGMFVPAMKGQKARELGSVDYRHPLRTEDKFDSTIDDFSIASIALSLKAISLRPELLNKFGADDRLLFCSKDYQNIAESECMEAVRFLSNDVELAQILGLFYIAYAKNELVNVSFKLFNIERPRQTLIPYNNMLLSTKVTKEDLAEAVEDEYGVKYSKDGMRLLLGSMDLSYYKVREGTKVICDSAFSGSNAELGCYPSLISIFLPDSLVCIGNNSFISCVLLSSVNLPLSLKSIGDYAFGGCESLCNVIIPSSIIKMGSNAFFDCGFKLITKPEFSFLKYIITEAIEEEFNNAIKDEFGGIYSKDGLRLLKVEPKVETYKIKEGTKIICDSAFFLSSSLKEVYIPSSVQRIGKASFFYCSSIKRIVIDSSNIITIGKGVFYGCRSLKEIIVPKGQVSRFKDLLLNSNCDLSVIKDDSL